MTATPSTSTGPDWSRYAEVYDFLLANNPAYQQLIDRLRRAVQDYDRTETLQVLDLGAGTGNFGLLLAELLPGAAVHLVEPDPAMLAQARAKARERGLTNVTFHGCAVDEFSAAPGAFDWICAVHALYTFPAPRRVIAAIADWLGPGGHCFLCDLGRPMRVGDWGLYLARQLISRHGPVQGTRLLWQARKLGTHNRQIAAEQRRGRYWTHTHDEFLGAVSGVGLDIAEHAVVYRGYSDLVVARRSAPGA